MMNLLKISTLVFAFLMILAVIGCGANSRKGGAYGTENPFGASDPSDSENLSVSGERDITVTYENGVIAWSGGAVSYLLYVDGTPVCKTEDRSFTPDISAGLHELKVTAYFADGAEVDSPVTEIAVPYPPLEVFLYGGELSWTAQKDAIGYIIYKEGAFFAQITGNSYICTQSGTYSVSAVFGDERFNGRLSNTVIVDGDLPVSPILKINGSVIEWSEVDGAENYRIFFNGKTVAVCGGLFFDLYDEYAIRAADYPEGVLVTVCAVFDDDTAGSVSNAVFYAREYN